MSDQIPTAIVDGLAGFPQIDVLDIIIPLLTVDDAGFPHVCLLSRAELSADENHVYAVVSSTVSKANLVRERRATIALITPKAAYYCKLDVDFLERDDYLLGVVFSYSSMKVDGDESFHMQPPQYLPTREISESEHWNKSRPFLERLQATYGEVTTD